MCRPRRWPAARSRASSPRRSWRRSRHSAKPSSEGALSEQLQDEGRRRLAAALFNHVWTLLETPGRGADEDEDMVHAAHASAYHWSTVGTIANRARGEWQCSRVYAVLGRAEPALHHARRCLELCESAPDEIEEFGLPFACEAMARAHTVGGDADAAREWLDRARAAGEKIEDEDDRVLLEADLANITL